MQNAAFFYFARVSLFRSKKHSLLSRISKYASFLLFLLKKTYKKKVEFLPKTMYQPLCKMSVFLTLLELNFSGVKSILYFPENKKLVLPGFFCWKKKMRKRSIFWQKPWTNPFANCRFFSTLWELHFWGPKSFIFYPEYQKMFLFGFFCLKRTYKKKVDFLTKTMD